MTPTPWSFFLCLPCDMPMTKPIRSHDEHACPSCKRCIDGWYPPADVQRIPVGREEAVAYKDHTIRRNFEQGTHTVDGQRGPLGLSEIAGVREALLGEPMKGDAKNAI